MNTKDMTMTDFKLRCLVYGKSGTGKTVFASTFPRPYFFDFDRGLVSIRGKNVEYEVIPSVEGKDAIVEFEVAYPKILARVDIDTIVIDSVTTLEEYAMAHILAINRRAEPTLHEWSMLVDWFQSLFMRIIKSNKNVCVVAHEQVIQDELTSEVWFLPLIVGKKLPQQIALFFDEVYRASVSRDKEGKPVYQLMTRATTRFTAKSRLRVLDEVEVPDYTSIMKKVNDDAAKTAATANKG